MTDENPQTNQNPSTPTPDKGEVKPLFRSKRQRRRVIFLGSICAFTLILCLAYTFRPSPTPKVEETKSQTTPEQDAYFYATVDSAIAQMNRLLESLPQSEKQMQEGYESEGIPARP